MNGLTELLQQRLVFTLAHFVWQAAAIALLLGITMAVLRVAKPATRYVCSLTAFVMMAACPVVTWFAVDVAPAEPVAIVANSSAGHAVEDPPEAHTAAADRQTNVVQRTAIPVDESTALAPGAPEHSLAEVAAPISEAASEGGAEYVGTVSGSGWNADPQMFVRPALWFWLTGVALLSLRLVCGSIGIRRWRRESRALPVEWTATIERLCVQFGLLAASVRLSDHVGDALAVGLLKPLVLLPAAWITALPPDMLEAVIAHELAHLRRWDLWVNLFQRVIETLFFYHPVVWWLSRRLRIERELCCDVLAAESIRDTVRYAETLERVARLRREQATPQLAAGFSGHRGVLLHRVNQLLGVTPTPRPSRGMWLAGLLSMFVAGCLCVAMSAARDETSGEQPSFEVSESDEAPATDPAYEPLSRELADRLDPIGGNQLVGAEPANDAHVRYAEAALKVARRELEIANDANDRVPGAVPDSEIKKLEMSVEVARLDRQIAQHEFSRQNSSDSPDADAGTPTDLYVRRAKVALTVAQQHMAIATESNTREPYAVPRMFISVLRMEIEQARLDLQIAEHELASRTSEASTRNAPTELYVARADLAARIGWRRLENARELARSVPEQDHSDRIAQLDAAARTARLQKEIVEARHRRAQALHAGSGIDDIEADLLNAELRLAVHRLDVFEATRPRLPTDAHARKAVSLERPTLIRWGKPVGGLQIGLERVDAGKTFRPGSRISFQYRIRNSSANPVTARLRYSPASSSRFEINSNRRVSTYSFGTPNTSANFQLRPEQDTVIPESQFQFDTTGLESGRYAIESYHQFQLGESEDVRNLKTIRGPGWTSIPGDLPFAFELVPPATSTALKPAPIEPEDAFDVAWGLPVQGLQAGLKYKRGLEFPKDFNRFTDWQWSIGDTVEADVLIRNVSLTSRTFTYAPSAGSDLVEFTPYAHLVMPYDTYGPLQGRTSKASGQKDMVASRRRLKRSLKPGESFQLGRTAFVISMPSVDRNRPQENRIRVKEHGTYDIRTTTGNIWNRDTSLRLSLRTGALRLWTTGSQPRGIFDSSPPELEPLPGNGTIVVRYSFPAGPEQANILIRSVASGPAAGVKFGSLTLRNGEESQPIQLPAGLYEVGRAIHLTSRGMLHTELCDHHRIVVMPDSEVRVELTRRATLPPAEPSVSTPSQIPFVTTKHRVEGLNGNESVFITVHPGDPEKWMLGEPARYFDYRARRRTLCATTCDSDGQFQLEPLPAGRYVVAVRAFEPAANGQFKLKQIRLPYKASCATFIIRTDLGVDSHVHWSAHVFRMIDQWNHPLWFPQLSDEK